LTGLIGVIIITLLLVYLQSMRIYIPITLPRYGGIKSRVPLQFLYVANIPVLLVGILFSNIILFNRLASAYSVPYLSSFLRTLAFYMSPPRHGYELLINPARVLIYAGLLFALGILFGFMWIEVSGLSPSGQAEQLIKSGLEIPGVRRNPKILESLLAKYIYPLTLISSIIVCAISLFADLLGTYGGGIGILLAVGIIQQYYTMIAYEQALEMYPLLKRFIGEE
ncbi:MAG: preprotein translocase subunit SecY, partial [Thermoprotei archaeon]